MNDRGIIHDTAERLGWFVTRATPTHTTYAPTDDPWDDRRISIEYDGPRPVSMRSSSHVVLNSPTFIRLLSVEHLHRYAPTTEETPPMTTKTAVNASRDGLIDLALDSGWTVDRVGRRDELRKTNRPRLTVHFDEDGNLERVEYDDVEIGTSDWIPNDPQERAFQLCRTIVGPGGHVPDPDLVKLRHDVEELERGTDSRFHIQKQRMDDHGRDIRRIDNRLEKMDRRNDAWIFGAYVLIIAALVLAIVAVVPA